MYAFNDVKKTSL